MLLGIRTLLTEEGFEVVGEVSCRGEVLPALQEHTPDILLLASNLFPSSYEKLYSHLSRIASETSTVLLVSQVEQYQIRELMAKGIKGIVGKEESTAALLQALRAIAAGNLSFSESVLERVLIEERQADESPEFTLHDQEKTILQLICADRTNREIACALSVSEKAIEKQLAALYAKLGVKSRVGAAIWATHDILGQKK